MVTVAERQTFEVARLYVEPDGNHPDVKQVAFKLMSDPHFPDFERGKLQVDVDLKMSELAGEGWDLKFRDLDGSYVYQREIT